MNDASRHPDSRAADGPPCDDDRQIRLLVESMGGMVSRHRADGTITYVSPSCLELLGFAPEELLQTRAADYVHPDDRQSTSAAVDEAAARRDERYRVVHRMKRKDGRCVWVETAGRLLYEPDGPLREIQCMVRDVTDRKRAEADRQKAQALLEAAIAQSPSGILIADAPDVTIRLGNEAAFGIRGGDQRLLTEIGVNDHANKWQTFRPDGSPYPPEELPLSRAVLRGETTSNEEVVIRDEDGNEHWVTANAAPIRDARGRIAAGIVVFHDITDRKRAETEREELIAILEAQNAELERFTYTVSHDLKSPLITIKGFAGLLRQDRAGGDSVRVEYDLARITGAADTMSQLLNDLLELSRVGRLVNPPEDVSLEELAFQALDLVGGQVHERGVQVDVAPDLPVVFGDRLRLLEVLQNLIDNAVKYMGPQSQPRVEIGTRRDAGETVFFVRDNGIGIEPDFQEKVFGLFDQLDQKVEGSGIGLALVKRIIELHGGRIWIESEGAGSGSTFCFTLAAKGEQPESE